MGASVKKFIYIIADKDNKILAAYEKKEVAEKLLPVISKKLDKELIIIKQVLNSDVKSFD